MTTIAALYIFMAGNLVGSGVGGHALRLTDLVTDGVPYTQQTGRFFVGVGALVIYGLGAIMALLQSPVALAIAIGGPILGVSTVLLTKGTVDPFQKVLGVFQLVPFGLAIAIILLKLLG